MLVEGEKRREVHQVSESSKSVSAADFRERWRRVWAEGSLGIILEPTFDLRVEGGLEEGGGGGEKWRRMWPRRLFWERRPS